MHCLKGMEQPHPRGHEASVVDYVACRILPHASVHEGTISNVTTKLPKESCSAAQWFREGPG